MSKVKLAEIPALTFYKDAWTEARRTTPIAQLTCLGKACKLYQPEVVRCVNLGGSGTDVDWKCEADLPEALRFGKVGVSCEGWSKAGDPYVLKGSCGLEYRLVEVPGALRNGATDEPWTSLKTHSWGDIIFTILWLAFVFFIVYSMIASCFRRNNGATGSSQGRSGPRPGGGGGGGGGWFPGDHRRGDDWANPPPPYSKTPPNQGGSEGWRPGFWTGAAAGGLASHFWNNRQQAEPRPYWNQWNQVPPTGGPGPMFGGFGARRPARFDNDDRGEGSSNLGNMRRSTGIGGSNVR